MAHVCKEDRDCLCEPVAEEPSPRCPRHGAGWFFPPRCRCGRFVRRGE